MRYTQISRKLGRIAVTAALGALTVLSFSASGPFASSSAQAAEIVVNVDEASIHRLVRSAATVIVGNPSTADVNVQSGKMLVVLGKNPGSTNLIALDRKGVQIDEVTIHVRSTSSRSVTLYRGVARLTYNCAPTCDRTLVVGDNDASFQGLQKQIAGKSGISQGSADAAGDGE